MDPNGQNPISIARLFEGINLRDIIDTHTQDAPLNLHIIQVNKVFPGLSALFQQKKLPLMVHLHYPLGTSVRRAIEIGWQRRRVSRTASPELRV